MQFYRFSIAWSRVLPNGDISSINAAGIDYYSRLIDRLLANDIQPMVTMYHYDLPAALQQLGGLANPLIVDYFQQYAELLFSRFGSRVKKSHYICLLFSCESYVPVLIGPTLDNIQRAIWFLHIRLR